jgi:hypothetical protein
MECAVMTYGMIADVWRWTSVVLAAGVIVAAAPALTSTVQTSEAAPRGPESGTMPPAGHSRVGPAHGGVIAPPPIGDPVMDKGAPLSRRFATPVIPPPGTPAGDPQAAPRFSVAPPPQST